MEEFKDMYNEGVTFLTDNGVPLKVEYLDRFLAMLQKKFYPEYKMPERAPLRLFDVSFTRGKMPQLDCTVAIAQVVATWPFLTHIIEAEDFKRIRITTENNVIEVERVFSAQIELSKKEK